MDNSEIVKLKALVYSVQGKCFVYSWDSEFETHPWFTDPNKMGSFLQDLRKRLGAPHLTDPRQSFSDRNRN